MKFTFYILLLTVLIGTNAQDGYVGAQDQKEGSVDQKSALRVFLSRMQYSLESNTDSLMYYSRWALRLAQNLNDKWAEADALDGIGYAFHRYGDYSQAMEILLKALDLARKIDYQKRLGYISHKLGHIYRNVDDYRKAEESYRAALSIAKQLKDDTLLLIGYTDFAFLKILDNQVDSAIYINRLAENLSKKMSDQYMDGIIDTYGVIYEKQNKFAESKAAHLEAVRIAILTMNYNSLPWYYNHLAGLFRKEGNIDSSNYYAMKTIDLSTSISAPYVMIEAANILAENYHSISRSDSAYKYLQLNIALKDSLFDLDKTRQSQWLLFNRNLEEEKEKSTRRALVGRIRLYVSLGGIAILLFISAIMYRNMRRKQRDRDRIEKAYTELKDTQAQLIQREKMASLGELTAGIAHEIQNPLNFVNNFSEVNKELVDELQLELKAGKMNDAITISNELKENEQKINFHGKRAESIVKSMLQHSRSSSGKKEPTNINVLAEEYLRLAYHGFRAKDKSFNSGIETSFDPTIGKVNVVPQEIGRVILNLVNNAFYAVDEKKKQFGEGYEPMVKITTNKQSDKVEIKVTDNGNGIPQKLLDKIFQPFFTTKPTGEGTGLGLSLAYEMVKAHGGELRVSTKEGDGSEFIIELPN